MLLGHFQDNSTLPTILKIMRLTPLHLQVVFVRYVTLCNFSKSEWSWHAEISICTVPYLNDERFGRRREWRRCCECSSCCRMRRRRLRWGRWPWRRSHRGSSLGFFMNHLAMWMATYSWLESMVTPIQDRADTINDRVHTTMSQIWPTGVCSAGDILINGTVSKSWLVERPIHCFKPIYLRICFLCGF